MRVDIVGDIHGQLDALSALGRQLGYAVDDGWSHPEERLLVFLGDLVDRGPASLEVAELVEGLVREGRALCLMGNHEYNLVGYELGLVGKKHSNAATIEDVERRSGRWAPVIEFFKTLPLAIELPGLRLIHAVWHRDCFERVHRIIGRGADPEPRPTIEGLRDAVVLESPFTRDGLVESLPSKGVPPPRDSAVEILIKGFEAQAAEPFRDSDGRERDLVRVCWWQGPHDEVVTDRLTVFGHYWNAPPVPGLHDEYVPPFPSGHEALSEWQRRVAPLVPPIGTVDVPAEVRAVCVDYNGVTNAKAGNCVGAFRWPERQVTWARLEPVSDGDTRGETT